MTNFTHFRPKYVNETPLTYNRSCGMSQKTSSVCHTEVSQEESYDTLKVHRYKSRSNLQPEESYKVSF